MTYRQLKLRLNTTGFFRVQNVGISAENNFLRYGVGCFFLVLYGGI